MEYTKVITYAKNEIKKAEGDIAEAAFWTFDALVKQYGVEIRKLMYGSPDPRGFGRAEFKTFFNAFNLAATELAKEEVKVTALDQFDKLPPFEIPKVTKQEVIELLQNRTNTEYMPSANGTVQYNSKPQYVRVTDMDAFKRSLARETVAGYYTGSDDIFTLPRSTVGMWAALPVTIDWVHTAGITTQLTVFVNLSTLDVYYGNSDAFVTWPDDLALPLDRVRLQDALEML